MAKYNFSLPEMGEGIIEATITKWLVEEGSLVTIDMALVEVATDKVDSEVPSPVKGRFVKKLFIEGDVVKIGIPVAVIETDDLEEENKQIIDFIDEPVSLPVPEISVENDSKGSVIKVKSVSVEGLDHSFSNLLISLAKAKDITLGELIKISKDIETGSITKNDLDDYILLGRPYKSAVSSKKTSEQTNSQDTIKEELTNNNLNSKIIEMDRMRKIIAENMIRSKRIAPHVTSFIEADVSRIVSLRESIKQKFFSLEGVKLTYTPFFVDAVAKSLKDVPRINSSIEDDKIIIKSEINIGIATALQNGNLIVPVIRNADKTNISELAHKITDLAGKARRNDLKPADIKGGTFTITNLGQFENITGTPIINQPEVAILAIGVILKKPAVIKENDTLGIGIRDIVMLSLTFDHRLIDGAMGGKFLSRMKFYLENFDENGIEYV